MLTRFWVTSNLKIHNSWDLPQTPRSLSLGPYLCSLLRSLNGSARTNHTKSQKRGKSLDIGAWVQYPSPLISPLIPLCAKPLPHNQIMECSPQSGQLPLEGLMLLHNLTCSTSRVPCPIGKSSHEWKTLKNTFLLGFYSPQLDNIKIWSN